MKTPRLLAVLVVSAVCCYPAMAQSGSATMPGIEGTYYDPDGNPLGYASVALYDASQVKVCGMVTAVDGSFRFSGLQAGSYYLEFSMPGAPPVWYGGEYRTPVIVGNTMLSLAFSYPRGPGIAGTCTGPDGAPLAFTTVTLHDRRRAPLAQIIAAADGSFRFMGLKPGVYYLEFTRSGSPSVWYGGASAATVEVGSATVSVEFRAQR